VLLSPLLVARLLFLAAVVAESSVAALCGLAPLAEAAALPVLAAGAGAPAVAFAAAAAVRVVLVEGAAVLSVALVPVALSPVPPLRVCFVHPRPRRRGWYARVRRRPAALLLRVPRLWFMALVHPARALCVLLWAGCCSLRRRRPHLWWCGGRVCAGPVGVLRCVVAQLCVHSVRRPA